MKAQPCPTFRGAHLCGIEHDTWLMIDALVVPSDVVLEFGARYGTSSCALASATNNSGHVISVEPDPTATDDLLENRRTHRCNFAVVQGSVGDTAIALSTAHTNGYEQRSRRPHDGHSPSVPNLRLEQVERRLSISVNVVLIDCEGCVGLVLGQAGLLGRLDLVMIEEDATDATDYARWHTALSAAGFVELWRSRDTFEYTRNLSMTERLQPGAPRGWKPAWSKKLYYTAWRRDVPSAWRHARPSGGSCSDYGRRNNLSRKLLDCAPTGTPRARPLSVRPELSAALWSPLRIAVLQTFGQTFVLTWLGCALLCVVSGAAACASRRAGVERSIRR